MPPDCFELRRGRLGLGDVLGVPDRRDAEKAGEPGELVLVPVALLQELLVGLLELLAVLVLVHLAGREQVEIVGREAGLGRLGRSSI